MPQVLSPIATCHSWAHIFQVVLGLVNRADVPDIPRPAVYMRQSTMPESMPPMPVSGKKRFAWPDPDDGNDSAGCIGCGLLPRRGGRVVRGRREGKERTNRVLSVLSTEVCRTDARKVLVGQNGYKNLGQERFHTIPRKMAQATHTPISRYSVPTRAKGPTRWKTGCWTWRSSRSGNHQDAPRI